VVHLGIKELRKEKAMVKDREYPTGADVGTFGTWYVPVAGGVERVQALLIGTASTKQERHTHAGDQVADSRPCPACRWFEVRIFAHGFGETGYTVHTAGMSDLPGESDRGRAQSARDAFEAVHLLSSPGDGGRRFLSAPVRDALEQAALTDAAVSAALREW
jgi:hypothetical protein